MMTIVVLNLGYLPHAQPLLTPLAIIKLEIFQNEPRLSGSAFD